MTWFDSLIMKSPGWLKRLLIWGRSWLYPPSPRFDSEFIDADRWAEGYIPQGDSAVYSLVAKVAESQYNFMISLSDSLDKKADDQVRFIATLVGAVTAAASAKVFKVEFVRPGLAIWALVFIFPAIFVAWRARAPQKSAIPMSPRDFLRVADLSSKPPSHQMESVIAASYHVAIFRMRSLTTWKARLLNRSALAFTIGFALLLASIIPL
jgi:hypothetical protein